MSAITKTSQILSDENLCEIYRKAVGSPIRMTFWGGMILDPNKVYITEKQAERSTEYLRQCVVRERGLPTDATWDDIVGSR